jgi:hypothetical protein
MDRSLLKSKGRMKLLIVLIVLIMWKVTRVKAVYEGRLVDKLTLIRKRPSAPAQCA